MQKIIARSKIQSISSNVLRFQRGATYQIHVVVSARFREANIRVLVLTRVRWKITSLSTFVGVDVARRDAVDELPWESPDMCHEAFCYISEFRCPAFAILEHL